MHCREFLDGEMSVIFLKTHEYTMYYPYISTELKVLIITVLDQDILFMHRRKSIFK